MGKNEKLIAVGAKFQAIRKTNGLTQDQMASFLGVHRTLITKFESGERSLGMADLEKACRLFGCDLPMLFNDEEYIPLTVAFRARELDVADLEAISMVHKMVINLRRLKQL